MKIVYFASFFILLIILVFLALYYVEIPSPSIKIIQDYNLKIQ